MVRVVLFAVLPETYRVELAESPGTIAVLEAHAAKARAELDVVAALVAPNSADAGLLDQRGNAASSRLASSVAALERIRIDLLRLQAGARNLASPHLAACRNGEVMICGSESK